MENDMSGVAGIDAEGKFLRCGASRPVCDPLCALFC